MSEKTKYSIWLLICIVVQVVLFRILFKLHNEDWIESLIIGFISSPLLIAIGGLSVAIGNIDKEK